MGSNVDIFWQKDESLEDTENLPDPDTIACDIVENLESILLESHFFMED